VIRRKHASVINQAMFLYGIGSEVFKDRKVGSGWLAIIGICNLL
jgi:hypothetical protein